MNTTIPVPIELPRVNQCQFERQEWIFERFLVITVFGGITGLFGVVGNCIIAFMFIPQRPKTPNRIYVSALAISDACILTCALSLYCVEHLIEYTESLKLYHIWLSYIIPAYGLGHLAQTSSIYMTALGTLERYFAISPNKERRLKHPVRKVTGAYKTLSLVVLFAVVFNYPKFMELRILESENCTSFASYSLMPSPLAMDPIYREVYSLWANAVVIVFFPFLFLFIMNILTIKQAHLAISKQSERRYSATTKRLRRIPTKGKLSFLGKGFHLTPAAKDATIVFIVIVSVFLICNCWGFVLTFLEHAYGFVPLRQKFKKFHSFSREAVNYLGIFNASVNFLIYIIFSRDFRANLKALFYRHFIWAGKAMLCRSIPNSESLPLYEQAKKSVSPPAPAIVIQNETTCETTDQEPTPKYSYSSSVISFEWDDFEDITLV